MTEFSSLSKFEKFEIFKEDNYFRDERKVAAIYLKSLWLNDIATIKSFEDLGSTPYHFISNYRTIERFKLFGFENYFIDENGWVSKNEGFEIEKIELEKNNYLDIGKSPNGKYSYGYHLSGRDCGSYSSCCHWGDDYSSKDKCINDAYNRAIEFHAKNDSNIAKKLIKLCESVLNKEQQLTLF